MFCISIAHDARILSLGQDSLVAERRGRKIALRGIGGLEPALQRLGEDVADGCGALDPRTDGDADLPAHMRKRVYEVLQILVRRGIAEVHCLAGERLLMVARSTGHLCALRMDTLASADEPGQDLPDRAGRKFQLSRFACIHRADERLVVECPQRSVRVTVVAPEIGTLIAAFAEPRGLAEIGDLIPGSTPPRAEHCLRFLAACGVIEEIGQGGQLNEDTHPELRQREFHDVLMHMQSRWGLTDSRIGGVFPFAGVIEPSPAIRPSFSGDRLRLPHPDLELILKSDPPLAEVMENRSSYRKYSDVPLSAAQLGEFLYRVARIKSVRPRQGTHPEDYETSNRTYPSGGATYDLEIYPAVRACDGVTAGLYHYEPLEHTLTAIPCEAAHLAGLFRHASFASRQQGTPQVLFTITSRFSRLAWKYRGIAYATTLRNVGVLYEAMYLTATAMGLAPCALGSGDSALFSVMTSLDPLIESSVGEFMLGTRER